MMRVSFLSLVVIFSSLAVASAGMVLWVWLARRRRDEALRTHGKPLLVMPTVSGPDTPRPALVRDLQPHRRSPITALAVAERLSPEEYRVSTGSSDESLETMTTGETVMTDEIAELIQGRALRFHRPADHSRPFLPGHLRVIEGSDAGVELRFVRLAQQEEEPIITFGRSEGPPFRHVQLLEPTVSRAHARMVFDGDGWSLSNLSRTNPVLVNRSALGDERPVPLRDGDRIEMGALVFQYVWK